MTPYFELSQKQSAGGVAYVPAEFLYEYYDKIREVEEAPFTLLLEDGLFEDYLANDLGWPLMSERLRDIFNRYKKEAPKFKWTKAKVLSEDKILHEYFYLISLEKPKVLDLGKTRMINDSYIYGFFVYDKIKNYAFFPHESKDNNELIINEKLKNEIVRNKISGALLTKADLV